MAKYNLFYWIYVLYVCDKQSGTDTRGVENYNLY